MVLPDVEDERASLGMGLSCRALKFREGHAQVSAGGTASSMTGGMLSMVGTPIGNLDDASPRVLATLRSADVLLCEDTRVTSKLLARFDIRVSLMRCDQNVIVSRLASVLDRVEAGERVAFVSDAGMPGVSDPGQQLVDAALELDAANLSGKFLNMPLRADIPANINEQLIVDLYSK